MDVQSRRHVAADPGAIFQRHPAAEVHIWDIPVDDDPNQHTGRLAEAAHVDQLHAVGAANRGD